MKNSPLPEDLLRALGLTARTPGWNTRPRGVRRFDVGACVVYVVPFRRWAYRRQEQQEAAWHAAQA